MDDTSLSTEDFQVHRSGKDQNPSSVLKTVTNSTWFVGLVMKLLDLHEPSSELPNSGLSF